MVFYRACEKLSCRRYDTYEFPVLPSQNNCDPVVRGLHVLINSAIGFQVSGCPPSKRDVVIVELAGSSEAK